MVSTKGAPPQGQAPVAISVNIPTKNSAGTLEYCLRSVRDQAGPIELIVADDCSDDATIEIAQRLGARVLEGPLLLLEARYRACLSSSGDLILMLDSDQILRPGVLERAREVMKHHDALVLEEASWRATTWLPKLYEADRRLLHSRLDHHLDPEGGGLLPRLFRRSLLQRAFELIPVRARSVAVAQDHAIIFHAFAQLSPSIGYVPDGILHREMDDLTALWRKYFRWGEGLSILFSEAPEYRGLTSVAARKRFTLPRGVSVADWMRSLGLLALKSVPYSLGYLRARIRSARGPASHLAE